MRSIRAFSFVELVVVMAVLSALIGVGVVVFSNDGLTSNQNARTVAREVQLVRFEAINLNEAVQLDVDLSTNTLRSTLVSDASEVRTFELATARVSLEDATGFPIVFTARGTLTRDSAAAGLDVSSGDESRRVCINLQGAVSVRDAVDCT